MSRRLGKFILAVSLVAFTAATARAETPDFTKGLPPAADTTPIYPPPPPPPQDRKSGNGAAIAAAAVGAAFAGMSCAMLMKQAQETEDPNQKAMLMAMAMQQCGQMAQDIANAAKNDEGQKAMTNPAAEPKFADMPQGASKDKPTTQQTASLPSSSSDPHTPAPDQTVNAPEFKGLPDVAFNGPAASANPDGSIPSDIGGGVKPLPGIDRANVIFDDSSKGGGKTPDTPMGASTNRLPGSTANNKADGGRNNLEGVGGPDGKAGAAGRKRDFLAAGGDSGGGSHSDSHSSGGGMDFAGLLAQLQGKPAGGPGAAKGPEVVNLEKKPGERGPSVNIFQYASFRYRKAQRDDGLVIDVLKKAALAKAETLRAPGAAVAPPVKAPVKARAVKGQRAAKGLGKATVVSRR